MSAAEWYFTRNNQQQGPVTLEAIRAMAGTGELQRADLVWRQGMANWQPAAEVEGVFVAPTGPAPLAGPYDVAQGAPEAPRPQTQWQGPTLGGASPAPYPGGGMAQPFGHGPAGESFKSKAVTAFVVSILGLFICGLILGIVAIVQSNEALKGMRASGNEEGKGLAVAARVIGIIGLVGWGIALFARLGSR